MHAAVFVPDPDS